MIKKGLLSNRTEQETPENVRPLAARLGPLKTVCRALKMHVGQAKGKIDFKPRNFELKLKKSNLNPKISNLN